MSASRESMVERSAANLDRLADEVPPSPLAVHGPFGRPPTGALNHRAQANPAIHHTERAQQGESEPSARGSQWAMQRVLRGIAPSCAHYAIATTRTSDRWDDRLQLGSTYQPFGKSEHHPGPMGRSLVAFSRQGALCVARSSTRRVESIVRNCLGCARRLVVTAR